MDLLYVREQGENFWASPFGVTRDLAELGFAGHVAVIGKGPDLDLLGTEDLAGFDSVICVNESIHVVERLGLSVPTYAIQVDASLGALCRPSRSPLLIPICAAHQYRYFDDKYVFRLNDIAIERVCTAAYAVGIARSRGAAAFTMFAFNAVVNADQSYATAVGAGTPRDTSQWHRHKEVIEKAASGAPVRWIKIDAGASLARSR